MVAGADRRLAGAVDPKAVQQGGAFLVLDVELDCRIELVGEVHAGSTAADLDEAVRIGEVYGIE